MRAQTKKLISAPCPQQLSLLLREPRSTLKSPRPMIRTPEGPRLMPLDQRMSTAEVLRVVGVNRSTLFRWTRSGRFPHKHASGGWLRSDIELWLAQRLVPRAMRAGASDRETS
jgi:predicted DNA-binding transcriptional regulator AlpA